MPRAIEKGVWKGNLIRRARKAGRCQYWLGEKGRCPNQINAGDEYFEGEMDDWKAGGFARERYCMTHLDERCTSTNAHFKRCLLIDGHSESHRYDETIAAAVDAVLGKGI